jgi:hypothetical protein
MVRLPLDSVYSAGGRRNTERLRAIPVQSLVHEKTTEVLMVRLPLDSVYSAGGSHTTHSRCRFCPKKDSRGDGAATLGQCVLCRRQTQHREVESDSSSVTCPMKRQQRC